LQHTEIAARIDTKSAEIAVFAGNFSKFPVKFPVLREFEKAALARSAHR
jgi:hypothetical protein